MEKEQVGVKTPEFISLQFQLAGLGSRAAAFIIDQLILSAVNLLLAIIFIILIFSESYWLYIFDLNSFIFAMMIIAIFVIQWGYFILYEYFSGGRTVGKNIMGIRVIQENGHSITFLSSFIRNLLRIIDSLPISYLLGIFMIFLHPKHKRLGDLVAGTIVVHEQKTKQKNKMTLLEKEIMQREASIENYPVEDWALNVISQKDWQLLQTYSQRFLSLSVGERESFTNQVANILYPKIGWDLTGKTNYDLENGLLALYDRLREDWEYEL
ncbi:RDD family protein [Virgibacillus soli]|uniref:RDD family protein n=1 Tax=Paracerasibacillus soli TaxID=480284 RepID=UPI0035EBE8F9